MKKIFCVNLFLLINYLAKAQFGNDGTCNQPIYNYSFASNNDVPVRATFQTVFSNNSSCSCVLVNQQTDDQHLRQLFVTARHCIHAGNYGQGTLIDLNNVIFLFNFQSFDGDKQHTIANQPFVVGNRAINPNYGYPYNENSSSRYVFKSNVSLISETTPLLIGNNYAFGVDIALLEIQTPIPKHFNVAYAGWTTNLPAGPLGIVEAPFHLVHHPQGDIKKYAAGLTISKNDNPLNATCRIVTRVIGSFLSFFGIRHTSIERICNYVDIPQYVIPYLSEGGSQHGSSGSPLFNKTGRIIANTSASPGSWCVNVGSTYGKFRNAYAINSFRNALNPNYDIATNLFGIGGRSFACKDNEKLSGNYFPAHEYQPSNVVKLSAAQTIKAGRIDTDGDGIVQSEAVSVNQSSALATSAQGTWEEERFLKVANGANFTLTAGKSIELLPGFQADAGSVLSVKVSPCGNSSARKSAEIPTYDQVASEDRNKPLPQISVPTPYVQKTPFRLVIIKNNSAEKVAIYRYSVAHKGAISIFVTDLMGNKIMELITQQEHSMGIFTEKIDISKLNKQAYVLHYKAVIGNETNEQQLVVN